LKHQPHFNVPEIRKHRLAALRKRLRGDPFYSRTAFSKVHDSAVLRAWPVDREEMAAELGLSVGHSIGASQGCWSTLICASAALLAKWHLDESYIKVSRRLDSGRWGQRAAVSVVITNGWRFC
jgi:hypothetical protein